MLFTSRQVLLMILYAMILASILVIILVEKNRKRLEKLYKDYPEVFEKDPTLQEKYEKVSNRILAVYVLAGIVGLSSFAWAATITFF